MPICKLCEEWHYGDGNVCEACTMAKRHSELRALCDDLVQHLNIMIGIVKYEGLWPQYTRTVLNAADSLDKYIIWRRGNE